MEKIFSVLTICGSISDSLSGVLNKISNVLLSLYFRISGLGIPIGVFGFVVGTIIALLATKNKGLRRFGVTFAIAVPVITTVVVYGGGYLIAFLQGEL